MSQSGAELQNISDLLRLAHEGDEFSLSRLLEWSRRFLREEARQTLSPQLQVRVDESDLVQKVCLAAFEQFGKFHGKTEGEYVQWLRKILQRDIQEVVEREKYTAKRTVDREVSGDGSLSQLVQKQLSPSRKAIRNEERKLILEGIQQLPDEQQAVVRLRYFEHLSLRETAERLGKTENAVMSLLKRGIFRLNELLKRRGLNENERES